MNDLDLMLFADGEGDPASNERAGALDGADAQAKIEGLREVGSLVRGHLELAADDADDRLAGLWDLVERRLDAEARAEHVVAPAAAVDPGLWARVTGWLGRYRSQVLTGVVTAGAAAAITMLMRPAPHETIRTVQVPSGPQVGIADGPGGGAPTVTLARATPTEVESLEVNGGTGAVFTIRDDDDDGAGGDGETTVIWVTPDDVVEGL